MSDLLKRRRRHRTRRDEPPEELYVPATSDNLKALYIDAYQATSLRHLTTNLGRAVVQNLQALEFPEHDENAEEFSEFDRTLIDRALQHGNDRSFRVSSVRIDDRLLPVEDFLDRARRLDELGRTDSALDVVYNHVDEMLLGGKFAEVDDRLASTSCDGYSVDLLLALLTITHAAKQRLPHRQQFYARVEKSIRDRGEWEDGLLYGLE